MLFSVTSGWLAHARPQGSDAATLKMLWIPELLESTHGAMKMSNLHDEWRRSGFDLLHPLQVQVGLRRTLQG